jgi:hypothetical protein
MGKLDTPLCRHANWVKSKRLEKLPQCQGGSAEVTRHKCAALAYEAGWADCLEYVKKKLGAAIAALPGAGF